MSETSSAKKRTAVGVRQRHGRGCTTRGVGSCRCPWAYVVELPADGDGYRRQITKAGFSTQKAAKEARAQVLDGYRRRTLPLDRSITVRAYLEQWWAWRTVDAEKPLRPTTQASYRDHLDRFILPSLGGMRLADLTAYDVERWLRQVRAEHPNLSAASRLRVYATLRSALGKAVERKMLPVNPCQAVDRDLVPTGKAPEVKPWEPEELGRFLDAEEVQAHRLAPLFHVAAFTAARRGELVGLRWSDVSLDPAEGTGLIRVTQQAVQVGQTVVVGPTKSEAGQRTVALDPGTVEVLAAWKVIQDAEKVTWGEAWHDTGLVFTHEDGSGWQPEVVSKTFGRLVTATGLRRITFHTLRHGAGSLWLAGGADITTVSKMMGHSSLAVTAGVYAHLIGDVRRQTVVDGAALVPRAAKPRLRAV